jgi:hypothetical protein
MHVFSSLNYIIRIRKGAKDFHWMFNYLVKYFMLILEPTGQGY